MTVLLSPMKKSGFLERVFFQQQFLLKSDKKKRKVYIYLLICEKNGCRFAGNSGAENDVLLIVMWLRKYHREQKMASLNSISIKL